MISNLLSWIIFTPMIGFVLILLMPKDKVSWIRWTAVVFTFIPMALSLYMYAAMDQSASGFQFVEQYQWIPAFNIHYFLGVDGISAVMVILTGLLGFLSVFASWNINKAHKAYFALYLLLVTAMFGVFLALDFFLFYVFWELMLFPMYFLIGIWGGPRREYAAIKFFLYTLAGSVLMLVVILVFYFNSIDPATGKHTFSIVTLMNQSNQTAFIKQFWVRLAMYIALFIAFAIKVPVFPFHTWLPDAHVEAPTAISVILAGVLLKMGAYGIMRISYPLLPDMAIYTAFPLAILGLINIVYGALVAMAQTDFKKMIAYSSVSHMGYVMLGLSSLTLIGFNGALMQMFNHGTITGMLFLLVGVVYDRAHHRDLDGFGGLASYMPVYAGITSLAFMASLGLPGLSGFIGEALVFLGTFKAYPVIVIISALGVIFTAGYFLWAYQRVFFGPANEKYKGIADINGRELFTLIPLALVTIFLGIYPLPFFHLVNASLTRLLTMVGH
ncbi:MAG: NADH-quinone oxidoreductase subunit M [Deltaproteobacteria bacterium]|nr:NADH-quinone oxidoreductase subunit M [Deltaproteobacteria bacterium]MCL5791580.1 NADH-quinone oxidoreductase subunit M [Deltaproteobacteria bacterium]